MIRITDNVTFVVSKTTITIVRFRYDDDKPKIFAGRAKLRDQSIRVSNDLTVRQRKELKRLQSKGQRGYFYQGQLIIKRLKSAQDNNKDRVFVSAARRLPQQANSESARDTLFMNDQMELDNPGDTSADVGSHQASSQELE